MVENLDIKKARQFKARANDALKEFESARERLNGELALDRLKTEWSTLLSEYRKCLKFLEQSGRNLGRNAWADALAFERKSNVVLSYLFHARNVDEHGVEAPASIAGASFNVGNMFSFGGNCQNITISNCSEITTRPDGSVVEKPINGVFSVDDGRITEGYLQTHSPISRTEKHLLLSGVTDRGVFYPLPMSRVPAEEMANEIAKKCFAWLDKKNYGTVTVY